MNLREKYIGRITEVLRGKRIIVLIVAIFLVGALAVVIFVIIPAPAPAPVPSGNYPLAQYELNEAAKGEIVEGFPKDLLVEKGVEVDKSYSLTYSGENLNQPVVTYISKWSMIQNVVQFGAHLRSNGWTVTHEADPLFRNTFYYARKDAAEVNITFETEAGRVKVVISYIKR